MIPLLRACHLQPTVAVTAIATTLAVSVGRGAGSVWVALAVLAGQLSVGWSNDYLDRDRDRLAGRADKPIVAGQVTARAVAVGALIAALACVPLSMISGWRAGSVHLAAVGGAWAYNGWLKGTLASVVPFSFAFGVLPAFVTLGLPGHPWPPVWATVAAALMGTGAHFVNTLPDFAGDATSGIRGLPHRVGPGRSLLLGFVSMAAATVVLATAPSSGAGPLDWVFVAAAAAAALAVMAAALQRRLRVAWSLTLCAAALNVAVFITRGASLI
ncbi:MAG: UbiA family prenyltransferase [Acidimicrobiia bacterium]|nr:UbiA family prenyltransferase [Acidimicrobiia bacterium]